MDKELLAFLEASLDTGALTPERISGGDINDAYALHGHSQDYFLKLNDAARGDMFEKEKLGLELLRGTGAIQVPDPISAGRFRQRIYLLMAFVKKGSPAPPFWRQFGHQLAALHRHSADMFGLDHDNYIGSLPQPNGQQKTWAEFYAVQRILFLVRMAYDQGKCGSTETRLAERFCGRLQELVPEEKPCLLHGDLWSGNFMAAADGSPCIFDPAVYYGHREMDIGMTLLFGGFDNAFYDHYNEAWPFVPGWRQRMELAQLYPLLVHLVLFGGHYYSSVKAILKKYT